MPSPAERLTLWRKSLPDTMPLEADADLKALADAYEMSGASILNAMQYAFLQVLSRGDQCLRQADLAEAIKREFTKDGKSM
jgi:AAA+ superfamily predicted ATPase